MEISGANAIVTGAAGGIGEAIAQRLLEQGASVVIGDLDAGRLSETAARLGADHPGRVSHVAGNAADAAHVAALIEAAGEVDAYFANAGVFQGFGLGATDAEWALSWDVNVKAHVVAARALVPGWVERGRGCFASTASAAGLLTQLGSPTYATTKHAAVGFAEWLAASYGDRGVQVCCLCPMGVRTPMTENGDFAEGDARLAHGSVQTAGDMMSAVEVADALLGAVSEGRFLALPHANVGQMYVHKAADPDRWLSGMQRYRRSFEG